MGISSFLITRENVGGEGDNVSNNRAYVIDVEKPPSFPFLISL